MILFGIVVFTIIANMRDFALDVKNRCLTLFTKKKDEKKMEHSQSDSFSIDSYYSCINLIQTIYW